MLEEIIIYSTDNYNVVVPRRAHIPREDGGHLMIVPKVNKISRIDLNPQEAKELMMLTMLIGEAMTKGLKKSGIILNRINYQDNGNWAFIYKTEPHLHIHLYGRVENSKTQKNGEALYFRNPFEFDYTKYERLNENDIKNIVDEINILKGKPKYNLKNW